MTAKEAKEIASKHTDEAATPEHKIALDEAILESAREGSFKCIFRDLTFGQKEYLKEQGFELVTIPSAFGFKETTVVTWL